MEDDSLSILRSWYETYLTMCIGSLLAALGSVVWMFSVQVAFVPLVLLVISLVLTIFAATRWFSVRKDLLEGPVRAKCYVQSYLLARRELLFVKTPQGTLTLGNITGYDGKDLVKRWVTLEYARRSKLALKLLASD